MVLYIARWCKMVQDSARQSKIVQDADYADQADKADYADYSDYAKYAVYAVYAEYARYAEYSEYAEYAEYAKSPSLDHDPKGISIKKIDFDNPKIYSDTSILDGIILHPCFFFVLFLYICI